MPCCCRCCCRRRGRCRVLISCCCCCCCCCCLCCCYCFGCRCRHRCPAAQATTTARDSPLRATRAGDASTSPSTGTAGHTDRAGLHRHAAGPHTARPELAFRPERGLRRPWESSAPCVVARPWTGLGQSGQARRTPFLARSCASAWFAPNMQLACGWSVSLNDWSTLGLHLVYDWSTTGLRPVVDQS